MAQLPGVWESLPKEIGPPFRAQLPALAELISREIQRRIPGLAPPGREPRVRLGVERALGEFADRLTEARGPAPGREVLGLTLYRGPRRYTQDDGPALDALQSAFRLGARLAWSGLERAGAVAQIEPVRMYGVAEAVFVYVEELIDLTRKRHAETQAWLDDEMRKRRERLAELLVRTPPPGREAVAELARTARWTQPATVRAVALYRSDPDADVADGKAAAHSTGWPPAVVGTDALVSAAAPDPFLLLPDPGPATLRLVERALSGWRAAMGPSVPLSGAGASLRWARRLLDLSLRGLSRQAAGPAASRGPGTSSARPAPRGDPAAAPPPVLDCADHLPALILTVDEPLTRVLVDRRLAPLRAAAPAQRDRLAATLLCWLECRGSAPQAASRLGVHPQTVRYRLRRLEELFGPDLDDPRLRFELELAARGRALLAALDAPR